MNEFKEEMIDKIEKIGNGSVVHHGKNNDRIYLMKLSEEDYLSIIDLLQGIARDGGYSKIFCKIPSKAIPIFIAFGFFIEGYIPRFYGGREDACFVSYFLNDERARISSLSEMCVFSNLLKSNLKSKESSDSEGSYSVRRLGPESADEMARLYVMAFKSYPFPIQNPQYLIQTMGENIQYFGVFNQEQLVALASSDVDVEFLNAEMTDFATHPQHKGHRLSRLLLRSMEKEMKGQGIKTLYTIARLNSIPMNKTFLSADYSYCGTLVNNTQIGGSIESMNLYYKIIS